VDATEYLAIGHSTFAIGRFTCAFLNLFIKPRLLLLFFFLGALVCSIIAMREQNKSAEAVVLVLYFFEGPIFSLIYGISLRGLGRFTKDGAALITAAISGGGVFPPILYGVARGNPALYQSGYRVVVTAFALGMIFPIYLNCFPLARQMSDPVKTGKALPHSETEAHQRDENGGPSSSGRPSSAIEAINGPKLTMPEQPVPARRVERVNAE
jgi:fucose permease